MKTGMWFVMIASCWLVLCGSAAAQETDDSESGLAKRSRTRLPISSVCRFNTTTTSGWVRTTGTV